MGQSRLIIAMQRLERAERYLADAMHLAERMSYRSSVNRSYYAVHASFSGLLLLREMIPQSHKEMLSMICEEFIATGQLPDLFGETFRLLMRRREEADYGDDADPDAEEAEDSINRARELIAYIRQVFDKGEEPFY